MVYQTDLKPCLFMFSIGDEGDAELTDQLLATVQSKRIHEHQHENQLQQLEPQMCHVGNKNVVNVLYRQGFNSAVSHDMLPGKLGPQHQQGALCAFLLWFFFVIDSVMDNTAPTC